MIKLFFLYFLYKWQRIKLFIKSNSKEYPIFFHHIPRCGGTSFRHCLKKHYNVYNDYRIGWSMKYLNKINLNKLSQQDCVVGHFEMEIASLFIRYPNLFLDKNYFIFSIVRDPLDLAISNYYYRKQMNQFVNDSLEDYLCSAENFLSKVFNVNEKNYKPILERYDYIGIYENLNVVNQHLSINHNQLLKHILR